ncbi:hypothetical protein L1887_46537 [Cichorium endivia]|nr:hypothetical protein L1887_46537 [Cichorium endivia]
MRRVGQNNGHLVFTGGQPYQDHRFSAGVSPVPWRVIHHHVNVPDARGDLERVGAEYRLDAQVFGPILYKHRAFAQRPGKRGIDDQLCGRLRLRQRGNGGGAVHVRGAQVIQRCGLGMGYRCQDKQGDKCITTDHEFSPYRL